MIGTNMRKIISFCVASALLFGGVYLGIYFAGFLFIPRPLTPDNPARSLPIFILLIPVFLILLGGYWLWTDFIAPAFGRRHED